MMRRFLLPLFATVLSLSLASAGFAEEAAAPAPQKKGPPKVGDALEAVTLQDLEGKEISVKLEGAPSALVFFNSACSACRAEMSVLDKLSRKEQGLKVYAVCTDVTGADGVKRFREMTKMERFTYYLDPELKAATVFGFSYTPATVLVHGGKISLIQAGYMNSGEQALMDKVLQK